jgi:tetraacyldisaccharide 4'-kinase
LPLERPIALCGIARPERFIFLLKKMNISISAQSIFNDHHEYDNHEIESIYSNGASGIITTEKDAFRLKSLKLVSCPDIWYLKIDLVFCEPESEILFNRIIDRVLT